jgi:predicted anti-sigma-YlaC factor YlaD
MRPVRPLVCERARGQISVGLDGELSQLERAMITSHVERCDACQQFEREVSGFTRALRETPLEVMARPVTIQRPRRQAGTRIQMAAAAAVAVAALVGASQAFRGQHIDIQHTFIPEGSTKIKYQTRQQVEQEQAMLKRARPGHPVQLLGEAL